MTQTPPELDREAVVKRALSEIRDLRQKLSEAQKWRNEPIAVIGLGCRFPGDVDGPDAFWTTLMEGRDATGEVPPARWDVDAFFDPQPSTPGKMYTRRGGFLSEDVAAFDPGFFRLSPREATTLDPQQRLLLEVAWEAFEHAGRPPRAGDKTGVFVGISTNDYAQNTLFGAPSQIELYTATGAALNAAAGRIAFTFGLQGPAMAVDTACSSSLVAVHLACRSLRLGECRDALAGGVSLILSPAGTIATCQARMMAPDGRCKTFDASADGYGRGEGCGLVVLKRLSDALADGDDVLAVIRGSAVNQDGASGGLTVPNGAAQRDLFKAALVDAQVQPAEVGMVEAHGTGTPLGDPIELESIQAVYGEGRDAARPCAVGSVKTNIGHLEAAAGIAGLIKTVLALRHETIPRHLHLQTLNPQIELAPTFVIPTADQVWPRGAASRFAGVSSFGFTGTNAHLIVGEGPSRVEAAVEPDPGPQVITLSGRSEAAVRALAERYKPFADAPMADIAFAASAGRSHFEHRIAVLAETGEQLAKRLDAAAQGKSDPGVLRGQVSGAQRPKIAFVFTGQGSQYAGMGKELYDREPVFRAVIDRCDALLDGALLPVLFEDASGLIDQTGHTQPALFALEYALCALWRSWGVEPSVVLGHSVGEYVAACVAGVFSLEEGLKLVARRAQLMQALPPSGAMAAVWASEADLDLSPYGDRLSLAAVNGPGDLVVSGEAKALDALRADLERKGVASRPLTVSHAFHSPLMAPILEPFADLARTIDYQRPQVRLIRDLDGDLADGPLDADYWTAHLRQPVRFHDALQTLKAQDCTVVIEIGPHPILTAMARPPQAEQGEAEPGPRWLPSLRRKRGDLAALRETLAGLYVAGAPIDWTAVHRHQPHNRIHLPTYPFQRKPYWMAPTPAANTGASAVATPAPLDHPFLGGRLSSPLDHAQFETQFNLSRLPMVGDHRIFGMPWVNFATYLELAFAGAREAYGAAPAAVKNVTLPRAMILRKAESKRVQLVLERSPEGRRFQVFAHTPAKTADTPWVVHGLGELVMPEDEAIAAPAKVRLDAVRARCANAVAPATFYAAMEQHGVTLGPACRWLEAVWRGEGEALGEIRLPRDGEHDPRVVLDLGAMDAAFQVLGALLPPDAPRDFVFSSLERIDHFGAGPRGRLWVHAVRATGEPEPDSLVGDLTIFDDEGRVVAAVQRARLQRVQLDAPAAGEVSATPETSSSALAELLLAPDPEAYLGDFLKAELAACLRVSEDEIDIDAELAPQIDSLIAAELNAHVERSLGVRLPVAALFDGSTLRDVTTRLLAEVSPSEDLLTEMLDALEHLTDDEAETRVAEASL
jgi:acyl transferase domain-containing protein